jgi:hypothetical protein
MRYSLIIKAAAPQCLLDEVRVGDILFCNNLFSWLISRMIGNYQRPSYFVSEYHTEVLL